MTKFTVHLHMLLLLQCRHCKTEYLFSVCRRKWFLRFRRKSATARWSISYACGLWKLRILQVFPLLKRQKWNPFRRPFVNPWKCFRQNGESCPRYRPPRRKSAVLRSGVQRFDRTGMSRPSHNIAGRQRRSVGTVWRVDTFSFSRWPYGVGNRVSLRERRGSDILPLSHADTGRWRGACSLQSRKQSAAAWRHVHQGGRSGLSDLRGYARPLRRERTSSANPGIQRGSCGPILGRTAKRMLCA